MNKKIKNKRNKIKKKFKKLKWKKIENKKNKKNKNDKKIVIINFFTPGSLYTKKNQTFRIFKVPHKEPQKAPQKCLIEALYEIGEKRLKIFDKKLDLTKTIVRYTQRIQSYTTP